MRTILLAFFLDFWACANAQATADTTGSRINFFSSLGVGIMDKSFEFVTANSVQTATGAEYRLSTHSRLGAFLSFDSYDYHTAGTTYSLDGTLRATGIALFYRYKFGTHGLQPYLKAGGGGVWLTAPTVTAGQGSTKIEKITQFVGLVHGEVGVQFPIFLRYSAFLGAERDWMQKSSLLNDNALRSTTFKVGLISSL